MNMFSWPAGLAVGAVGALSREIVQVATDPTSSGVIAHPLPEYLTQLGVSAGIVIVAAYMLRRSDSRDAKAIARESAAQDARIKLLEGERDLERRRADDAERRAQIAHDRLMSAFTRNVEG